MRAVGIRELKDKLSRYLDEVRRGEVILVTDRGRVIAELRAPSIEARPTTPVEQRMAPLIAQGILTRPLPREARQYRQPRPTGSSAEDLDRALDESRGDR